MKKIFLIISILCIYFSFNNINNVYAYESRTDITLTNPASFNGTYEIERFVLRQNDTVIIDSDDDFKVYDEKGIATIEIRFNEENVFIDLVYKMQMVGPVFKDNELSKYQFIYDNKTFTTKRPKGTPLAKTLTSIGMIVYDHKDLIWEFNFEKDLTLILKLEKKYNIPTVINKNPFLNQ